MVGFPIFFGILFSVLSVAFFCYFATPQIINEKDKKIERIDLTMVRRPKGNYEAYIIIRSPQLLFYKMK